MDDLHPLDTDHLNVSDDVLDDNAANETLDIETIQKPLTSPVSLITTYKHSTLRNVASENKNDKSSIDINTIPQVPDNANIAKNTTIR